VKSRSNRVQRRGDRISATAAFLEARHEAGVSYIFANFGSDHPVLIEAIADPAPPGVHCGGR
jgi:acetolactate synthase-1/2/3 large subunit